MNEIHVLHTRHDETVHSTEFLPNKAVLWTHNILPVYRCLTVLTVTRNTLVNNLFHNNADLFKSTITIIINDIINPVVIFAINLLLFY